MDVSFENRIDLLLEKLAELYNDVKTISSDLKGLKKEHYKIVKKIGGRKKKDPDAPKKAPSGFCKPRQISKELAKFLKVDETKFLSSPEVTKMITNYIRIHKLQSSEDNRVIDLKKPGGEDLRKLLNVPMDHELTFFNLQHFIKVHYE